MKLVVFDLDGTLALNEHRQHFVNRPQGKKDWNGFFEACDKDVLNIPVFEILGALHDTNYRVEIWSGRSDQVEAKTKIWLAEHDMAHIPLRLRRANDHRSDVALKQSWLDASDPEPFMVFDDRDSVVAMWRSNGIVCAQVAPGAF